MTNASIGKFQEGISRVGEVREQLQAEEWRCVYFERGFRERVRLVWGMTPLADWLSRECCGYGESRAAAGGVGDLSFIESRAFALVIGIEMASVKENTRSCGVPDWR